jgi:ribonucleoside-diphosphate reductase alpha chain
MNKNTKINILDEMASFTFTTKYAKYDEKKQRRETWNETVSRVEKMHLKKFNFLNEKDKADIVKAFDFVREKRVTPSMRSMQFGGKAIEAHHCRIYNCGVRHIDSIRSFAESFYALLCGTGVGFGITNYFLNRLPNLVDTTDKTGTVITYVVQDSIEGWSDSIEALLNCYLKNTAYSGRKIVFDYSKIRAKGAKLKTGGGKAPGYRGLKNCHKKVKDLLDTIIEDKRQSRLKTINAYDILMHCADAVLSGGVRRSACSVIFEATDEDMMNSKTGDWFSKNPQRARSNNSAIIIKGKTSLKEFLNLIEKTKEHGEPGFLYVVDDKQLLNPCFEISFIPVTSDGRCGFQMCNLTSINGSKVTTEDEFNSAAWAASLLGTLQAAYTSFPYMGHTSEELTQSEALLGVSITGMMDNPDILFNPKFLLPSLQLTPIRFGRRR